MNRTTQTGYSLVELMVAVVVALLLSLAVISAYVSQARAFTAQAKTIQSTEVGRDAQAVITGLMRQAMLTSVAIDYGGTGARNDDTEELPGDSIAVDFLLPAGFPIWPNLDPPFNRNVVRIQWETGGDNPYEIMGAAAAGGAGFGAGDFVSLAGSDVPGNTRVINLDIWPLAADGTPQANATDGAPGGFRVVVGSRAGPKGTEATVATSFSSVVMPRN